MLTRKYGRNDGKSSRLAAIVSEIKDGLLGNKICVFKFRIHNIMKAGEVRDETRRFVSGVLCYVHLA